MISLPEFQKQEECEGGPKTKMQSNDFISRFPKTKMIKATTNIKIYKYVKEIKKQKLNKMNSLPDFQNPK